MTTLLRKFLIELRRRDNQVDKFRLKLAGLAIVMIALGIAIDVNMPFNVIINGVRGIFAIVIGVATFAILYLYSVDSSARRMHEDINYVPMRRRFTYKQRRNLSFIGLGLISLLVIIMPKEGATYTATSSMIITALIALLAFARTSRKEHNREMQGAIDPRDL